MPDTLPPARCILSAVRTAAAFSLLLTLVACSKEVAVRPSQTAPDAPVSDAPVPDAPVPDAPVPDAPVPDIAPTNDAAETANTTQQQVPVPAPAPVKWTPLFNGKNLDGWKITPFGGEGEVTVEDGRLLLDIGNPLSGVNYTGKIPRINYEVELDAMRVSGTDFFCALTFPVQKDPCSLILGGWGGGVIGLSSINGMDASENETTNYREFKNGRWYHIRLRVLADRIQAWIDGEEIVDQDITERQISIRIEVELSKPFGFATYETKAALRTIRLRALTAEELATASAPPATLDPSN